MHLIRTTRQALADLCLSVALAFVLILLNISINFIKEIHEFFAAYAHLAVADWIVNILFFWLVVLLWVAVSRWRETSRRGQELERIVSSISPDSLLVLDADQNVVMCNASLGRMFGYQPKEMYGRKAGVLYEHWRLGSEGPKEMRESFVRDGFYIGIATGRRRDGRTFPLEIIGAELKGGDGTVLLLRDIGERFRSQEERRELERRAEQWQRLESLSTLAGGLAHDLNNLLGVISGNAEMAMRVLPPDAPARRALEGAAAAAQAAGRECDQMMTYSGHGRLDVLPLDLSESILQAGRSLPVPLTKKIALTYELAGALPSIHGDSVQIRHVVITLMARAVEAIGDADGRLVVRTGVRDCDDAFLRAAYLDDHLRAGAYVFLEVTDTGRGLDPKSVAIMFDPFFDERSPARGLEMAYALGIIRGHHGAVAVRSEPGGTTITVYLPAPRAG